VNRITISSNAEHEVSLDKRMARKVVITEFRSKILIAVTVGVSAYNSALVQEGLMHFFIEVK